MAGFADDDVVVHGDTERLGDIGDGAGHMHIVRGRRRIAGGVVVDNPGRSHSIGDSVRVTLNPDI